MALVYIFHYLVLSARTVWIEKWRSATNFTFSHRPRLDAHFAPVPNGDTRATSSPIPAIGNHGCISRLPYY